MYSFLPSCSSIEEDVVAHHVGSSESTEGQEADPDYQRRPNAIVQQSELLARDPHAAFPTQDLTTEAGRAVLAAHTGATFVTVRI